MVIFKGQISPNLPSIGVVLLVEKDIDQLLNLSLFQADGLHCRDDGARIQQLSSIASFGWSFIFLFRGLGNGCYIKQRNVTLRYFYVENKNDRKATRARLKIQ